MTVDGQLLDSITIVIYWSFLYYLKGIVHPNESQNKMKKGKWHTYSHIDPVQMKNGWLFILPRKYAIFFITITFL